MAARRAGAEGRPRKRLAEHPQYLTTTSPPSCACDEQRSALERAIGLELRQRITEFQLKEQAARLGLEQFEQLLHEAGDMAALAQSVAEQNVR